MATINNLSKVDHTNWIPGFNNMLGKENRSWWRTRKWWVNILVWTVIINGMMAMILWVTPVTADEAIPLAEASEVFITIFGAFATIGVIVIAQGSIIGEKQSGTAQWVMSNPVSSGAFILSKLVGNALAILVIIVLLQSALFYAQISLKAGELLPVGPFATSVALVTLSFVFFLTLTIMLGAIFSSRGPVIGIAIAVFIGQDLAAGLLTKYIPWLPDVLPQRLLDYAQRVLSDQPIESYVSLVVTSVLSVIFVMIAIWRFGREEY
jgi:ABC-2 type transport system permease protein